MKLYHLVKYETCFWVIVDSEDGDAYEYTEIGTDGVKRVHSTFPKADFTDREHFAGVVGKFMPEVWILGKGAEIEIQAPSLPELERAAKILQERKGFRS